jgi:hypothetical protein
MPTIQHCTVERNRSDLDTEKVAKLVRLLGSDKDGEVLAAVAALKRTLGVAGIDMHDLADVITVGLEPRSPPKKPSKPAKPAKPSQPAKPKWEQHDPDLFNWQSMCEFCRFYSRRLTDLDRDYIARVLSGQTGFDLGRATPELMRRLRGIVDAVNASRDADRSRNKHPSEKGRSDKDRSAN